MIFHWFSYPTDKQKWANYIGGPAKTKLPSCLLSNVFGNWFWKDFGVQSEAILGSHRPSEATSKASVIKYANGEGPKSIDNRAPTTKIFNLGPQCERETGRASQADDTPNGVGGFTLRPTMMVSSLQCFAKYECFNVESTRLIISLVPSRFRIS